MAVRLRLYRRPQQTPHSRGTGTDRIKDLESTVEQLQEQVAELEQWKPANTREHIIHLLTTTEKTQREIADDLDVSESWVSRVKNEL
jgi:DNA-directed RNA polymerase specialized sigma subunit